MAYNRNSALTVVIGFCSLFFIPGLFAQNNLLQERRASEINFEGVSPEGADYTTLPVASGRSVFREFQSTTIDNSIVDSTYVVGGGDVFFIFCSGKANRFFTGTINQNGDLFIPDLGEIALGKVSLQKAKQVIRDSVERKMKNVNDISVALRKVKMVTVSVTGMVGSPGTFQLAGTQRLWDAIRIACGAFEKFELKDLVQKGDLRSVRRTNRDSTGYFDLLKYIYKGDFSQNPYVYPGDEITVVPITDGVFVHGEINGPLKGWVPIHAHDRADDFLKLFLFNENSDTARIELRRRVPQKQGGEKTEIFMLSQNPGIELVNGDVLTVPPRRNAIQTLFAIIDGEILRPGMYPIEKNRTLARDLIAMAGDTTPFANTRNAVIIRKLKFTAETEGTVPEVPVPEFGEPLDNVRPELGSALKLMNSTKDFTLIRLRDNPDVFLETGDQVLVPRIEKTVYVSGNVKSPGGYTYVEGKSKGYYISKAGGFTDKANRSNIYLVAQYGDVRQIFDRNIVEDGDIIVVPMSQQYKNFATIILPILGTTLSALGLLLGLYATLK
jgi:protein involved in polysaccharide export with SLBB domain